MKDPKGHGSNARVAQGRLSPVQANKLKHGAAAVLGVHDHSYHNTDPHAFDNDFPKQHPMEKLADKQIAASKQKRSGRARFNGGHFAGGLGKFKS